MKVIGLLGGMSWQSTAAYYRIMNEAVSRRLGGLHSAKIVLYSVDFAEIAALQRQGDWDTAGRLLADAAQCLERAGADFVLICANTMHIAADTIGHAVRIPVVHVADVTAAAIRQSGYVRAGLLGTSYTMEQDFMRERLERHGLQVTVPEAANRAEVHRIIFEELSLGTINPASRGRLARIIERMAAAGAECVILGCTELSLILQSGDGAVPLFDTTAIHAGHAAELAAGEQ